MVEDGVLLNPSVDEVLCLHLHPCYKADEIAIKGGEFNGATASLSIKVKGEASHGAYSHLGVDGILLSAYLIGEMQSLISRKMNSVCSAVLSLGQISGDVKIMSLKVR